MKFKLKRNNSYLGMIEIDSDAINYMADIMDKKEKVGNKTSNKNTELRKRTDSKINTESGFEMNLDNLEYERY